MRLLSLENVSKSFNSKQILKDISFDVEKESFVSIFGPNASGKTTLLNLISGLVKPDLGEISWAKGYDKDRVSYVFQNYRETLFPWRNVWENISLPLKLKGTKSDERRRKVRDLTDKFSIDIELEKFPYQLSGGQQQLVAIMRAIITEPELLLLDEPFSALDFQKRLFLQDKVLEIWNQTRTTIIFISHDLEEAIFMADEVILIGDAPTRITAKEKIDLPRPRGLEIVTDEHFINYKEKLLKSFLTKSAGLRLWERKNRN
jgi:NitT/TauT family transport system ATP-binding protein